jgi:hypothetical protein
LTKEDRVPYVQADVVTEHAHAFATLKAAKVGVEPLKCHLGALLLAGAEHD